MAEHAVRLRALFDAYYAGAWRALRRLGVDPGGVDDAAQEVFLVVSRRLDDIEAGSEKAFVLGVATRVASDFRRRQHRHGSVTDGEEVLAEVPSPEPTPEGILDRAQGRRVLEAILAAIPEDAREVFVLYEMEELTMQEISQALSLPPGTVASRLRRGRELFQAETTRLSAQRARLEARS